MTDRLEWNGSGLRAAPKPDILAERVLGAAIHSASVEPVLREATYAMIEARFLLANLEVEHASAVLRQGVANLLVALGEGPEDG